jgi:hypothetical protein
MIVVGNGDYSIDDENTCSHLNDCRGVDDNDDEDICHTDAVVGSSVLDYITSMTMVIIWK